MCFIGFLHGCNKIHDWGLPREPKACQQCGFWAKQYHQDEEVQRKFLQMVFLDMCEAAGGYCRDHRYVDAFDRQWAHHSPSEVLEAMAASKYPANLASTKAWCRSVYPQLGHLLWTPTATGTLCCCARALDELD